MYFLVHFGEKVLLLFVEIAFHGVEFLLLVYPGLNVGSNCLELFSAYFGELDGQSFVVELDGFAPADVCSVDVADSIKTI